MNKDLPIVISLFSVAFLVRIVNISNVPLYGDEWIYWDYTNKILASNFVPRADVFSFSPPFLSYIGSVFTLLFEGDLNVIRMISVFFGSLTIPLLYLFGKAMYDRTTGLLAALFLCFSAFHILYSRLFMLEALAIFFITAFLYFFWLSWQSKHEKKKTNYACIAGAMMGLAFDAKYISVFLVPAIPLFVLWTQKFNFKSLLDKRIILIYIFSFLFVLPLLISLFYTGVGFHGMFYYSGGEFGKQSLTTRRVSDIPPDELIQRTIEKLSKVFTWGSQILISEWKSIFIFSGILLCIITLFSYLPGVIRREKRSCFLIILSLGLSMIVFISGRQLHYLMYYMPFIFVMLSHLTIKSFEGLKKENSYKNSFRVFIISLATIMLFSYIVVGATASYWDKGDYNPWVENAADYIKRDAIRNGYGGQIIVGLLTTPNIMDYPLKLRDVNASVLLFLNFTTASYATQRDEVDLESIKIIKPTYLVISGDQYKFYFTETVKRNIYEDYRIVSIIQTYPDIGFVIKRKNIQSSSTSFPVNITEDKKISQEVFTTNMLDVNMPDVMKIGDVYTAFIKLKNTEDSRMNFRVWIHSDEYTIFVDKGIYNVTLDRGSSSILEFKIVPIKEHIGGLPIMVDLSVKPNDGDMYKKISTVSKYVFIKR